MKYKIVPASNDDIKDVINGINAYNSEIVKELSDIWTPLEFIIKYEDKTIGGVLGGVGCWLGLEIKILWVDKNFRRLGLGSLLLHKIETEATLLKAEVSMLDTFSFQAVDFYKTHKYQVVGVIDNFPKNHQRIYLSKKL